MKRLRSISALATPALLQEEFIVNNKHRYIRSAVAVASALLLGLAVAPQALSQTFPGKPVRIIAAVPPGTPPDTLGRVVAQYLGEALGQPVLVENRPGAGTTLGTAAVADAPPDGYTLTVLSTASTIAQALYARPGFDAEKSFAPISLFGVAPFFLCVHPDVPASSLKELVDLSRAKPGTLNYGTAGSGTPPHLIMEMFKSITKADMLHVPHKGNHFPSLLAGQVQASFDVPTLFAPHVQAGKVRLLAVTTAKRHPDYPSVPTANEAGAPGLEATAWYGLAAPRKTPPDVIARLHTATQQALTAKPLREMFAKLGTEPTGNSPEQFATHISVEAKKWADAVKASGAKVD